MLRLARTNPVSLRENPSPVVTGALMVVAAVAGAGLYHLYLANSRRTLEREMAEGQKAVSEMMSAAQQSTAAKTVPARLIMTEREKQLAKVGGRYV